MVISKFCNHFHGLAPKREHLVVDPFRHNPWRLRCNNKPWRLGLQQATIHSSLIVPIILLNNMYVFLQWISLLCTDSPKCGHSGVVTVGASLGTTVRVRCDVDAFPPATAFSWTFNNSKVSCCSLLMDIQQQQGELLKPSHGQWTFNNSKVSYCSLLMDIQQQQGELLQALNNNNNKIMYKECCKPYKIKNKQC